jgi:hypothetical protein
VYLTGALKGLLRLRSVCNLTSDEKDRGGMIDLRVPLGTSVDPRLICRAGILRNVLQWPSWF